MTKLHEKSPCCQGKIRRFGGRRRQCNICHQTWSVWQRKRGIKPLRPRYKLLLSYLTNRQCPIRNPSLSAKIRNTLDKFNQKECWGDIPSGELIAIADAMVQRFKSKAFTVYYILLKDSLSDRAVIAPPVLLPGTENIIDWGKAFDYLPDKSQQRISVLVCDGRGSLVSIANKEGWLIQRCHFHLRLRISNYLSSFYLSRHPEIAKGVYQLVTIVLTSKDNVNVKNALDELTNCRANLFSVGLRRVISGFIKNYNDYRTYLNYPELHLPATTNAIESLIGSVREIQHRARGFRSITSLERWIIGLLKFRKYQTCNGKNQQN